jgi:hypothetical protein
VPGYLQRVFGSNAKLKQQQQQQQLYALQVTCLKSWLMVLNTMQQRRSFKCLQIAASAAAGAGNVVTTCDAVLSHMKTYVLNRKGANTGASSSSSSSRTSSSSSNTGDDGMNAVAAAAAAAPWVALLARCLFVQATAALEAAEAASSSSSAAAPSDTAAVADRRTILGDLPQTVLWHAVAAYKCMELLSSHLGAAGLPAEVLQQLQQQAAAAQEHIAAAQQQVSSLLAGHATGVGLDTSRAQQLCSFAQAVAGRIPLSVACNNPGCVSLAQRSELLLVGGKSYSRCARCKAVRCDVREGLSCSPAVQHGSIDALDVPSRPQAPLGARLLLAYHRLGNSVQLSWLLSCSKSSCFDSLCCI